jgi:amino acid transporter
VNAVIGQGIFLLPGLAVALLGPASLVALLVAASLAFMIALCFAEVGSRFKTTGGAYAYAREAFGPLVGFEVGWMLCVVCVVSWAALANGFTLVLGYFFPEVTQGWLQPVVAVILMMLMVGVNLKSAKVGGVLSTFCSVAKLLPLIVFIAAGMYAVDLQKFEPFAPHGYDKLAEGVLLLLYALVGFESSVVPAGEMEDPKKAVPISLISVMVLVCFIYLGVFVACLTLHPSLAGSTAPVSEAAAVIFGSSGASLIAGGIVISVLGINAAQALVGPRKIFAMAERGDLPEFLSQVDHESGVPRNAIVATFFVSAILAVSGTFKELALLGVLARFVQYISTCAAVFVFRRRDAAEGVSQGFKVPGGQVISGLTLIMIFWLITQTPPAKLGWGLVAMLVGLPFYFLSRDDELPGS